MSAANDKASMAQSDNDNMDDLDAFFTAAANADPDGVNMAAETVAGTRRIEPPQIAEAQIPAKAAAAASQPLSDEAILREVSGGLDLDGKFIAVDPDAIVGSGKEPFVLVPAHIHTLLPWWAWATIAMSFVTLITVWVMMPPILLDRLTSRLGTESLSTTQSVMRQLVMKGDRETIAKLYDIAATPKSSMTSRLWAVDTLGLINAPDADRALLRLELAGETDARVREAAVAARKQRAAAGTRSRQR